MANETKANIGAYLPLKGATVVVKTPLDQYGNPDYSKSFTLHLTEKVTGKWTSTESRASTTITNESGADITRTTSKTQKVQIIMNAFVPDLHATLTGQIKKVADATNPIQSRASYTSKVKTITGSPNTYEVTIDDKISINSTTSEPIHFDVQDATGTNYLKAMASGTVIEGEYWLDTSTGKVTFHESAAGRTMYFTYIEDSDDSISYAANPSLSSDYFQLEFISEQQSSETNKIVTCTDIFHKLSIDGDVANAAAQKDPSAAITYNYVSGALPDGVPLHEYIMKDKPNQ